MRWTRRNATLGVTLLTAESAAAALSLSAAAAPVNGPAISVTPGCIKYGAAFSVTGGGYSPATRVVLTTPTANYVGTGSGYTIKGDGSRAIADAAGSFKVRLRAPTRPSGSGVPRYQPRVIIATGSDGKLTAMEYILIGTKGVCNYLHHPLH